MCTCIVNFKIGRYGQEIVTEIAKVLRSIQQYILNNVFFLWFGICTEAICNINMNLVIKESHSIQMFTPTFKIVTLCSTVYIL